MRKVLTIAWNTYIEGIRAKTVYVVVAYGLLILAGLAALTPLALGEQDRILKDLGLAGIEVIGILLAIVIGTSLVYKEMEKRTIYLLISKPLPRHHFLAGKYLGMEMLSAATTGLMTLIFYLGIYVMTRQFYAIFLVPIGLIFLKISIVNALALFFSSLASPVLGAVFTFCLYLAGTLSRDILSLAERLNVAAIGLAARTVYYLLPNLGNLDVKNDIIFEQQVVWPQIWWALAYSLAYVLTVMLMTAIAFERKDLK